MHTVMLRIIICHLYILLYSASITGQSFDEDGLPNLAGRRAARFAQALLEQTDLPVELWDESFSTQQARAARLHMGVSRKRRAGHLDEIAATVILQSYLDAHPDIT